jgi:hypothetical protein
MCAPAKALVARIEPKSLNLWHSRVGTALFTPLQHGSGAKADFTVIPGAYPMGRAEHTGP